jgi:hypothetical protein
VADRDSATRAVTETTLGAWLLKSDPARAPMEEWVATDFGVVTTRCVRATYRTEVVREGQPVLLWLSGRHPDFPAGIHAHGWTTGPVRVDEASGPVMPVRLHGTDPVVPRAELLASAELHGIEVLRMPAASNPSWLDREAWQALREQFPQVAEP